MQRIVIKNFGPLKDVDLEIKDLMLFIGPQASGKSTIAKLIYFFRSMPITMGRFFSHYPGGELEQNYNDIVQKYLSDDFFKLLPPFFNKHSFIQFQYSDLKKIEISLKEGFIGVGFDKDIESAIKLSLSKSNQSLDRRSEIDRRIQDLMGQIFEQYVPFMIPTGRKSSFSPFRSADRIESDFQETVSGLRGLFKDGMFKKLDDTLTEPQRSIVKNIFKNILRVQDFKTKFIGSPDKLWLDILKLEDNSEVFIESASSGQQEALWLLLILLYSFFTDSDFKFFIEEPELSLYPESQKHLVDLFGLYLNAHKNNQLVITTHSPYILTAFNNLIYAHQVGQKKEKEVSEIIQKEMWIDPERVGAYFVDGGEIRSIIDPELQLIKAEEIDSASDQMSQQYSKLFDLDYENE